MHHANRSIDANAVMLRALLWCWVATGCAALLLFPALRQRDALIGWLPFWLVVAPLLDLALLHRTRLLALPHALLVRARQRWRPLRQARRTGFGRRMVRAGRLDSTAALTAQPR